MKHSLLFLCLSLISVTISAAEITLICEKEVYDYFPTWEQTATAVGKEFGPLHEVIKQVTQKADISIEVKFSKTPLFNNSWYGYQIDVKTPYCPTIDFIAHCAPQSNQPATEVGEQGRLHVHYIGMSAKKYQKKGIGTACMKVFDNAHVAHHLGYKTITLESVSQAVGFYEKLAFTKDPKITRPGYIPCSKRVTGL